MRYKVSFIDAPDGRVLDTTTETELGVIRAIASRLPMVGEDQLLVIEPVPDDDEGAVSLEAMIAGGGL